VLALQPQKCIPDRLPADLIALGKILLTHFIAWRNATS
jgi:hypothetical protein